MNGEYEVVFDPKAQSSLGIKDPSGNKLDIYDVRDLLNNLKKENIKLKKEVADWKEECLYLEANK